MTSPTAVIVGMPGAGKSTIGRRLSRALNEPLTDTDQILEELAGKPCGQVFTDLGEERFRELEAEAVAAALRRPGIVSLGGGAVMSAATRELLHGHTVVYLEISLEEGLRRTSREQSRPVLAADDPADHYRRLMDKRAPQFEEVATFRARSDERSPQRVVAEVLSFLETTNHEEISQL